MIGVGCDLSFIIFPNRRADWRFSPLWFRWIVRPDSAANKHHSFGNIFRAAVFSWGINTRSSADWNAAWFSQRR